MSLTGNAEPKQELRGKIAGLNTIYVSAYAIAVKNGFEGTEEEWLASLKAEAEGVKTINGIAPDENGNIRINAAVYLPGEGDFNEGSIPGTSAPPTTSNPSGSGITLTNDAMVGQTIQISAVDENGKPTAWEAVDFPEVDLTDYAKTEDIPTKPEDIGAQPAGNYALKTEIPSVPTKVSQFANDSGYQTAEEVTAIVNSQLGVIENGTY